VKMDTRGLSPRTKMIIRFILLAFWLELSLFGATFDGVVLPTYQPFTLVMLGGGLILWIGWHRRTHRSWFTTPLDAVIVGWWIVFALSILANGETWRRSVEALWYMGLYTLVYLILSDLILQGLPRRILSFAVLIAGAFHVVIGAIQTNTLLQTGGFTVLRRPVGLIGNPNAYGALLLILIPLASSELFAARRPFLRIIWGIYALAAAVLLFFSASRGAWIGAGVGLLVYGVLMPHYYDLTSWARLRTAWARLSRAVKMSLVAAAVMGLIGAAGAGVFLVRSLSDQSRSADLRTYLWVAAGQAFQEKPLTGWGLFTYGRQLDRFSSIPPQQPHSHAHNVIFTMAAELGIPGVLILFLSIGVTLVQMRRVWGVLTHERLIWAGQAAALIGIGVHHLLDTPAMMPVIALLIVIVLAGSTISPQQPLRSKRAQPIFTAGVFISVFVLLGIGAWAIHIHTLYRDALETGLETSLAGAEALDAVLVDDPRESAALLEQAYLYGLAADEDADLIPRAIEAYRAYLVIEPTHSEAWANLSALYWQAGDSENAQLALNEALRLAPDAPFAILTSVYEGKPFDKEAVPLLISPYAVNRARNEFLRDVIEPEYLPQVLRLVGQN
jgi:O-antigen ligase